MDQPANPLTIDQLKQVAADIVAAAKQFPPGPRRQQILDEADRYRSLAEMKSWLFDDARLVTRR